jgi:hypothetical protein
MKSENITEQSPDGDWQQCPEDRVAMSRALEALGKFSPDGFRLFGTGNIS